jgi:hypothetical protein
VKGLDPKRVVVAATITLVSVAFAVAVPIDGQAEMVDHHIFLQAHSLMRGGLGYYTAMDRAFRESTARPETVRGYRTPVVFWAWSLLPSPRAIWFAYCASAAAAGFGLLALGRRPLPPLIASLYLLCSGNRPIDGGWITQFGATEFWAVAPATLAVLAASTGRGSLAVALSLLAAATRELAAPLMVGGLMTAMAERRPARPWVVALVVATVGYASHAISVLPHLGPPGTGTEPPLLGTGRFPSSIAAMAGFGLPLGLVVGPVLWAMALTVAVRDPARRMAVPYLLLPLTGLLVDRPAWGVMVVPLTLAWGLVAVADVASRSFRSRNFRGPWGCG